ncbi:MAG: hypothetical protein LBS60_08950 [Deltaproteobacteria bacterium]|jgi:hypothetical protein|nr:hypothetical protein [Deltaproteobacteria bacterium]
MVVNKDHPLSIVASNTACYKQVVAYFQSRANTLEERFHKLSIKALTDEEARQSALILYGQWIETENILKELSTLGVINGQN